MHDDDGGAVFDDNEAGVLSNEEWLRWLKIDLQQCAAYACYSQLLEECCIVAAKWRTRAFGIAKRCGVGCGVDLASQRSSPR